MTKKIGIGVVGLGRMGQVYANHVGSIESADLIAIADANPEALENFTSQMSGVIGYNNVGDLFENKDIEAVIIATPTHTHRELVIAAAQAGKATFCEKPTALTLPETDEMVDAIQKAGVMFQVDLCAAMIGVTKPPKPKSRRGLSVPLFRCVLSVAIRIARALNMPAHPIAVA